MIKKKQGTTPTVERHDPIKALENATAEAMMHRDSRVITRSREVLMFELQATEEHLAGLRAGITEVTATKARLEARIRGITRALDKRGC